ncbi:MAG TPA: ABC transporter permease [bacterium]|nr:ABC transporter permease [bacterium]HNS34081.1 ABC transporter permease [bacterium]HNZ73073.1 ABC transporter permease [bacterium]HOH67052.1 ABC transporter permease [bacterium]HQA63708.1 ABC transporter permease [bacterium]
MRPALEQLILPFRLAWQSLQVYRVRASLTVLGIVIGIAAVIVVMSAGESIKGLILGEFEAFGTDFVQIEIKVPSTGRNSVSSVTTLASGIEITSLTLADAEKINQLSTVKEYGAGIMGQGVISYLDRNQVVNYLAGTQLAPVMMGVEISRGRLYTDEEDDNLAKVVILGSQVASDLFGNQDPIGQSVRLGRLRLKVVGIAKERGATFGFDFDSMIYLPLQTAQKLILGIDHLMFINARVHNTANQEETAAEIVSLLRERHDTANELEDDFAVTTAKEAMEMIDTVFNGITLLLVAIVGISLLVGGVGIMNIMYVSVTERTFEIGLRQAIGARKGQILWQFLWEAIVVTVFGGLIGIVIGVSLSFLISLVAGQLGFATWRFILPPESVIIAFFFCASVGLIFGYWPARRAATMDPINALRYEQ